MLLNSCQPWIKQEFQSEHPRKRKIKSKHVHSSNFKPYPQTKYCFPHWQASLDEQNVHAAQKAIPSAFWKVQMTASSFSFFISRLCLGWQCSHSSLSFQQALCYQTNMSPQHFKMHFKVTLHKFERQKQIHELRNESPEHDTKTQEYTQEQLPSPPTIMLSAYCS